MKTVVIIPSGGAGRRMGGEVAKQYLLLAGVPILLHTLKVFQCHPWINEIILVVPQTDLIGVEREIIKPNELSKIGHVIAGGKERQDSVNNALQHICEEHEIILVHDGVRPFVTDDIIERAIESAKIFGSVAVGMPIRDTVKTVDESGRVSGTIPREGLWLTQTPQAFRREVILAAYERARAEGYYGTDDASLAERAGIPVQMIRGHADNIKVTTPDDLARGERILCGRTG